MTIKIAIDIMVSVPLAVETGLTRPDGVIGASCFDGELLLSIILIREQFDILKQKRLSWDYSRETALSKKGSGNMYKSDVSSTNADIPSPCYIKCSSPGHRVPLDGRGAEGFSPGPRMPVRDEG